MSWRARDAQAEVYLGALRTMWLERDAIVLWTLISKVMATLPQGWTVEILRSKNGNDRVNVVSPEGGFQFLTPVREILDPVYPEE